MPPQKSTQTQSAKADFFDALATRWDGKQNLPLLHEQLLQELRKMGVQAAEHVVDVGCGTGNLTKALLAVLGTSGRITAVDISAAMVAQAQAKINDARASWHVADVLHLPCADGSVDRVLCYQVWPHFDDPAAVAQACWRVLKPGGQLHVWHTDSRARINHIHAHIDNPAVASDFLPSAEETAQVLQAAGFAISHASESEQHYLVTASKP